MTPSLPHATVAELLQVRAGDSGPGLLFEDRQWSWAEVVAEAAVRAAVLADEPRTGDRPLHVGVLLENTPEYLFLLAAGALSGVTVVGVNPTRRGAELAADIAATDVDLLLTEAAHAPLLAGLDLGHVRVVDVDGADWTGRLAQHAGAPVAPTPEALDPRTRLLLLFTSGSTGAPKAVVCSTGRLAVIAQANVMQFDETDVAYNAMPLFHGNAIMASWAPCLTHGATFALRRRFSASGFLPDVQRFGATFFNYVGRSLAYVLAQPERPQERDNRLRFGFGTEASTHDRAEFARRYGCEVFESYGSSEGTISIRRTPETPVGALGVPPQGQVVEIRDPETGLECPRVRIDGNGRLLNAAEATGEIVAVGAAARFEGYYANPEAEAQRLRGEDFWTGDLGYRDADGFFWFAGRQADWLRVDSENFAAAPVERILARFPGTTLASVYPVPDPQTGDRVMATLQLVQPFDPAGFADFLDAQADLGTKWAPTFVRVADEVPLTATRKVDKPALRRQLWRGGTVWHRPPGAPSYVPLDAAAADALEVTFDAHGRRHLLDL